ncbi:hypothetical protein [Marinobacter sp. JSM 1782161]|uniref:hypothetical protein n=1 Tax=Marinobacter sp. JSM 1782161 TaxID=2685906 RepID=UPI0014035B0B|nr:hypothetical protein [Marinobacter sp. JSM 1782161]
MVDIYRLCPACKIKWDREQGQDCPKCRNHAFFTMNHNDIGCCMYLKEQGLKLSDFEDWNPEVANG